MTILRKNPIDASVIPLLAYKFLCNLSTRPSFVSETRNNNRQIVFCKKHFQCNLQARYTTRFRLVYSCCQSCCLKRVLSSFHFVCLYTIVTIVHILLKEFKLSVKLSLSTQSIPQRVLESESNFGPELESETGSPES